jgi:hypothetical protein
MFAIDRSGGSTSREGQLAAANNVSIRVSAPRHVDIATPTRNDVFCGEYVASLYRLMARSQSSGIKYSFSRISYADVEHARNYLVSNFYYNLTDCTHILFVDDDMGFQPELVERMVGLREDVVGAICHKRSLDLEKLHSLGSVPFEQALASSLDFIGKPNRKAERKDGFVTVDSCGAGILLISRTAITRMIETIPSIVKASKFPKVKLFLHPFDKIRTDKEEFSEDISFCKRWTETCGGKIWASTASPIKHVGDITLEAKYDDLPADAQASGQRRMATVKIVNFTG